MRYVLNGLILFIFSVVFYLHGFSQNKRMVYTPWNHPILVAMKNDRNYPFAYGNNHDGEKFINIAAIDAKTKMLYFATTFGDMFDSLTLSEPVFNDIVNKKLSPFSYYNFLLDNFNSIIDDAKAFLRENTSMHAAQYITEVLEFPEVKKEASVLKKLAALDHLKERYLLVKIQFNCSNPKNFTNDFRRHELYSTLPTAELGAIKMIEDSLGKRTIYYNTDPWAYLYKATIVKEEAKVIFSDITENRVDSIPLNPEKIDLFITQRFDVFLLYRSWLENALQEVNTSIKEYTTALNDKVNDSLSESNPIYISYMNSVALILEYQKQIKDSILNKIDLFSHPDTKLIHTKLHDKYKNRETESSWMGEGMGYAFKTSFTRGNMQYELTDHRGNVLVTVSDKKIARWEAPPCPPGLGCIPIPVLVYYPDVITAQDSYPGGFIESDRSYNSSQYRHYINGQLKEPELNDNISTAQFWEYDSRIVRRWNVDTKASLYPGQTPYSAFDNSPIWKNDPFGESGIVTIDRTKKTITVMSTYTLYGNGASPALANANAKSIQDQWNAPKGTVKIEGVEYQVIFIVKGDYVNDVNPGGAHNDIRSRIQDNKDYSQNYIQVTQEKPAKKGTHSDDQNGSNTGVWWVNDINGQNSTTQSHEAGHGWGIEDEPMNLIGVGQPGMMAAKGTAVDAQFTQNKDLGDSKPAEIDPLTKAITKYTNTIDATKRVVTQKNIDELKLGDLKFDKNGNAKLGKLTNIYHQ